MILKASNAKRRSTSPSPRWKLSARSGRGVVPAVVSRPRDQYRLSAVRRLGPHRPAQARTGTHRSTPHSGRWRGEQGRARRGRSPSPVVGCVGCSCAWCARSSRRSRTWRSGCRRTRRLACGPASAPRRTSPTSTRTTPLQARELKPPYSNTNRDVLTSTVLDSTRATRSADAVAPYLDNRIKSCVFEFVKTLRYIV